MFQLLNYLFSALLLLILGLFLRILQLTLSYQLIKGRLKNTVPRKKQLFPMLDWFDTKGGYDKFVLENEDENGIPHQVIVEVCTLRV